MTKFKGEDFINLIKLVSDYDNFFSLDYSLTRDSLTIKIHSASEEEAYEEKDVQSVSGFIDRYRNKIKRKILERMH